MAWPGATAVAAADSTDQLGTNISGVMVERVGSQSVLWVVKNSPGRMFRLIPRGAIWISDTAAAWTGGRALRYPGGTGDPDVEDVTFTERVNDGLYTAVERNNANSGVSRNSILRFDPTQAGPLLVAAHEWQLTDLPTTAANSGIEAITWVPDTWLTARGLKTTSGAAYRPNDYPNHGTGLFLVGLEATGQVVAYALDHVTSTATRVTAFSTGFPAGVMALYFDRDQSRLWATCDDGCSGRSAVYDIETARVTTQGAFVRRSLYARPSGMPNLNNEGFALDALAACSAGQRRVFWTDDGNTGGNALRVGAAGC